jgi:hypothetical protein
VKLSTASLETLRVESFTVATRARVPRLIGLPRGCCATPRQDGVARREETATAEY